MENLKVIKIPFVQANVNEKIEEKRKQSSEFRKAWDESREEYRLIGEMIRLRKQEKVTQTKLAEMTGNKQQVISRIERKENMPSLRIFCNLLNVMGYELRIVKKTVVH